jgi:hypothetical protein
MVLGCQQYNLRPMTDHETIRHDDEAASRLLTERCNDGFDFGVI